MANFAYYVTELKYRLNFSREGNVGFLTTVEGENERPGFTSSEQPPLLEILTLSESYWQ